MSCFYPDGSRAQEYTYTPCSNTTSSAACCISAENDICIDGGLCYYPADNYIFRGACTDQTWNTTECASETYCKSGRSATTWEPLVYCKDSKQFCCQRSEPGGICCNNPQTLFSVPEIPTDILTALQVNGVGQSTDSGNTTSTETTPSAEEGSTGTASISSPPTAESTGSDSGTPVVTIALAVIIGLLVLAMAGASFFLWRRSRRQTAVSAGSGKHGDHFPYPHHGANYQNIPLEPKWDSQSPSISGASAPTMTPSTPLELYAKTSTASELPAKSYQRGSRVYELGH